MSEFGTNLFVAINEKRCKDSVFFIFDCIKIQFFDYIKDKKKEVRYIVVRNNL